jgi:GxxExxY protein
MYIRSESHGREGVTYAIRGEMHEINQITGEIVDAAYQIHSRLGPGLVEKVYESILERSLQQGGLRVERQKTISFQFDGMQFDRAFCVDLLVEGEVVVELKSLEKLAPIHHKQVLTYLRILDLPIGLLVNFGTALLKDGIHRIANPRASSAPSMLLGQSSCL